MIVHIGLGVTIVTFLIAIWVLICNQRTYKQRTIIIKDMFSDLGTPNKQDAYDSVSYEKHMFALVCFRNPDNLYKVQHVKSIIKGNNQEEDGQSEGKTIV